MKKDELKKFFTDEFMKAHTKFENFEDFLKAFEIFNPVNDVDEQLSKEDEKIKKHTKFNSWKEMVSKAINEEIQESDKEEFFD